MNEPHGSGGVMDGTWLRDFAARCLKVAGVTADKELADKLRTMAIEYRRMADSDETTAGRTDKPANKGDAS
jgi:hypothetical protein